MVPVWTVVRLTSLSSSSSSSNVMLARVLWSESLCVGWLVATEFHRHGRRLSCRCSVVTMAISFVVHFQLLPPWMHVGRNDVHGCRGWIGGLVAANWIAGFAVFAWWGWSMWSCCVVLDRGLVVAGIALVGSKFNLPMECMRRSCSTIICGLGRLINITICSIVVIMLTVSGRIGICSGEYD